MKAVELKQVLGLCAGHGACDANCPAFYRQDCIAAVMTEALAYIGRLETELAESELDRGAWRREAERLQGRLEEYTDATY